MKTVVKQVSVLSYMYSYHAGISSAFHYEWSKGFVQNKAEGIVPCIDGSKPTTLLLIESQWIVERKIFEMFRYNV